MKLQLNDIIRSKNLHTNRDNYVAKPTGGLIHLASNENPNGPSPKVVKVLQSIIPNSCRYPNDAAPELMAKLATYCGLSESQVMIGAGSTDIVEMVMRALTPEDKKVLFPKSSYAIYRNFANANNMEIAEVGLEDFPSYAERIIKRANKGDIGLIIIDNPNNPTGHYLSFASMKNIIENISSDIPILIDEAYFEFMANFDDYATVIPLIKNHSNVIVARTFSKIFGLASLRIGYAAGNEDVIEHVSHFKRIFDVSSPAIAAATVAIDDSDYIKQSFDVNAQGLDYVTTELDKLGIDYIKPSANYVCFNAGDNCDEIYQDIIDNGILVKDMHAYHFANHIRVSFGLAEENKLFIDVLAKVAKKHKLI
jgi:histidinol-phosphate aminotransferase